MTVISRCCVVVGVVVMLLSTVDEAARQAREKTGGGGRGNRLSRERDRPDASDRQNGFCELEVNCRGGSDNGVIQTPMKLPIRGPTGPPGPQGERGQRGEDGMPGLPGLPGLVAPMPKHVAFFVGLSGNVGPVKEHTGIIFDRIVTNVGEAYDPRSGRFTSPVNGTYQFNVVISAQGRQKAAVMIVKNGGMVATVWAESIPYWATASNVVVLSLERDDQVWLLLLNRASYLHGYMYTTFSGFLIFEN